MAEEKFKVFISWSGELAKRVATIWRDLLKEVFDGVEPFMSEEDIGAGERGLAKIAGELQGTTFGIVVVTQDNQHSQWVNYEAGALSKDVKDQTVRVAPSLVDFDRKNDVTGPLGQFQGTLLDRDGVERILVELSKVVKVDVSSVQKRFARAWEGEYESLFAAAKNLPDQGEQTHRPIEDIVDEILTIVRELARSAPRPARVSPTTYRYPARYRGLEDVILSALSPLNPDDEEYRYQIVTDEEGITVEIQSDLLTKELEDNVKSALSRIDTVKSIRFNPLFFK